MSGILDTPLVVTRLDEGGATRREARLGRRKLPLDHLLDKRDIIA